MQASKQAKEQAFPPYHHPSNSNLAREPPDVVLEVLATDMPALQLQIKGKDTLLSTANVKVIFQPKEKKRRRRGEYWFFPGPPLRQ